MKHGLKVLVEHYKSKEHWYIKYITWSIIGIVCFAILVHILKELGFIPAQKIFDFFDAWATILYAGVTLLLAGVAVWSIMDNRYARRIDRRERFLNEIIEWAISIISLRAKSSYKPYSTKKSREMSVTTKLELMGAFMDIHTKETYIRLLADKLGLKIFMLEVTRHLNNHIKLINLIFDGKVKNSEVMANHRRILNKSAESLITEATKIKAGDIS